MDPLAISSIAITSFSIILSIGSAIYKAVTKHKEKQKEDNHHHNHCHEEDLCYSGEHTEHHKHKGHSKIGKEEGKYHYAIARHNNDHHPEAELSGDNEFSLEH